MNTTLACSLDDAAKGGSTGCTYVEPTAVDRIVDGLPEPVAWFLFHPTLTGALLVLAILATLAYIVRQRQAKAKAVTS